MARVDGFEVGFTHRGSWKADLLAPGKDADVIPVAWRTDMIGRTIVVWFKTEEEVDQRLSARNGFRIAVAYKNPDGSTSSNNITGIFWVTPVEKRLGDHHPKLLCSVEARAKPTD